MASSQGSDAGKSALRAEYARLRTRLPAESRAVSDMRILRRLESLEVWQRASLLLTYVSFGTEIDTRQLMSDAWEQGKQVAVPRCLPRAHTLEFVRIFSEDDLELGFRGILEPASELTGVLTTPEMVGSTCIVPGLVFDADGHRIGYGGGYYDRFLAFYPGEKVALARAMQLSGNPLPREGNDVPVDLIVTESASWACHPM